MTQSIVNPLKRLVGAMGLGSKLAGISVVETPVLELATDYQRTLERMAAAGVQLIRERGADCLVLGCMIMAFLDATAELEDRVGVPVVNPAKAALRWPKRWSAAVSDTASWPTLCRPGWRPAS